MHAVSPPSASPRGSPALDGTGGGRRERGSGSKHPFWAGPDEADEGERDSWQGQAPGPPLTGTIDAQKGLHLGVCEGQGPHVC